MQTYTCLLRRKSHWAQWNLLPGKCVSDNSIRYLCYIRQYLELKSSLEKGCCRQWLLPIVSKNYMTALNWNCRLLLYSSLALNLSPPPPSYLCVYACIGCMCELTPSFLKNATSYWLHFLFQWTTILCHWVPYNSFFSFLLFIPIFRVNLNSWEKHVLKGGKVVRLRFDFVNEYGTTASPWARQS